mgnify:CR=1 FL=1
MSKLQIKLSDGRGRPIHLKDDPITIGRHPDNRLRLKDDMASRHHCVIEPDRKGGHRLRDLGSRNGTKLNGMRVTESELSPGDSIRIGAIEFLVEGKESPINAEAAGDGGASTNGDSAPATPRGKNKRGPTESPEWVKEIRSVIDALAAPGLDDENLQLVDARGQNTSALAGAADGPQALRLLLRAASRTRATDIHVEPKGDSFNVRMRVDGQMVWIVELPTKVGELMAGLIKTACHMHSAARDAVQEGHFSCRFPDRRCEYRVSFTPSVHGQKLVVRVLDQRGVPMALSDLGMVNYMEQRIDSVCNMDAGMILVCGPTGSGKTTTLYNALREIDRDTRNVITIEDPVEYQLDGVTQIPIDERQGNTFGTLLRSVLRQDPDVILLGEIRDEETARVAMQAAMTGHLVFSTVHSKDSISAVFRLLDLKVEPYLVANSLNLVLAQRLVRRLCDHCKTEIPVPPGLSTKMGRFLGNKKVLQQSVGCKRCLGTGYRGRSALFELLDVNDELRDLILSNPSIQAMKKVIAEGLFTTLTQYGYRLAADGTTSMDEVERVTGMG